MVRDLEQQIKEGKIKALQELYESFFPVLVNQAQEIGLPMKETGDAINKIFLDFWLAEGDTQGLNALVFFQEKIEAYRAASEDDTQDKHWLKKGLKSFSEAEQNMVRHFILNDNSIASSSSKFQLSQDEFSENISRILSQLATMGADHSSSDAHSLAAAFIPEPKYRTLVINYLNEEISLQQENELRHWVDLKDKHNSYFEELYEVWEGLKSLPEAKEPEMGKSWSKLEKELSNTRLGQEKKKRLGRFSLRMALGTLAVVGLLSFAGYWANRGQQIQAQDLPSPDVLLVAHTIAVAPFEEFQKLEALSFIPLPTASGADTLFIHQSGTTTTLSLKTGEILVRNPYEQLILRSDQKLTYLATEEKFSW